MAVAVALARSWNSCVCTRCYKALTHFSVSLACLALSSCEHRSVSFGLDFLCFVSLFIFIVLYDEHIHTNDIFFLFFSLPFVSIMYARKRALWNGGRKENERLDGLRSNKNDKPNKNQLCNFAET